MKNSTIERQKNCIHFWSRCWHKNGKQTLQFKRRSPSTASHLLRTSSTMSMEISLNRVLPRITGFLRWLTLSIWFWSSIMRHIWRFSRLRSTCRNTSPSSISIRLILEMMIMLRQGSSWILSVPTKGLNFIPKLWDMVQSCPLFTEITVFILLKRWVSLQALMAWNQAMANMNQTEDIGVISTVTLTVWFWQA